MKTKTGTIELYPVQYGKLTKGCIVRTPKGYETVLSINGKIYTNKSVYSLDDKRIRLHKYYVVCGNNIIGELHFSNYSKVKENDVVEFNTTTIPNRAEVGDEVEVFKFHLDDVMDGCKTRKRGKIVNIINRKHIIKLYGIEKEITCNRHYFKIVSRKDSKTICLLV